MNIVDAKANAYAEQYSTPEDALLTEVAAYTNARPGANMMSGHLQGKLLEMISCMVRPGKILEIGTFTGYSALCLAKGLQEGGALHTIELNKEQGSVAQGFFDRSFFRDQIILHIGNALEIIGELDETWDLVFLDADKGNYINYFNLVFSRLSAKGFILADNVLFHGEVLEDEITGKTAKAIQAFNEMILGRTNIEKLMLPVRDGLYLIRKSK